MYNYDTSYYGETNKVTIIGNMSRFGELDTLHAKVLYFTETPRATDVPYFLAKNMPNEKVVCSHLLLTVVGSAIAICSALYDAYQVFRSLSWYHADIKTVDVARCTFSCTMTITMHH